MELFTLTPDGVPVSCGTDWLAWADGPFTIARTDVGTGYVSTIFLGFNPGPHDRPRLFETMTFGIPEREGYDERYLTRADALAGHARHVALARAIVGLDGPALG